jgi:hypothetical protein
MERTFGQYLPGMREAVGTFLQRVDERELERLYVELLRKHEDHWPPPAAKLRRLLGELGSQPPAVRLLGAPPMCHEERAAGMKKIRETLEDLARNKRMPKPKDRALSERSDRERR